MLRARADPVGPARRVHRRLRARRGGRGLLGRGASARRRPGRRRVLGGQVRAGTGGVRVACPYRMLETIRQYGQEKLGQQGEVDTWRRRHRDWYADLAARAEADWISPRQGEWVARLRREHANLRAALEFSVADPKEAAEAMRIASSLEHHWVARGTLSEAATGWIARLPIQSPPRSSAPEPCASTRGLPFCRATQTKGPGCSTRRGRWPTLPETTWRGPMSCSHRACLRCLRGT